MYLVKTKEKNELIIKNSKFIGIVFPIETEDQTNNLIKETSTKYKDYTHLTFAYKLKNKQKYSDDNEPTGTAGAPIMEIINKNNLINVLIIVIRYFGGTKLGAGGLIRAYSKTARETIKKVDKELYIDYNYYELISNYNDKNLLNNLTNDQEIIKKEFKENIIYKIKVQKEKDNIEIIFKNTNIKTKRI